MRFFLKKLTLVYMIFIYASNLVHAEKSTKIEQNEDPFSQDLCQLKENCSAVPISSYRVAKSHSDHPVSIITREEIRRYNINSFPDLLRLVPGFSVEESSGSSVRVSYQGGTSSTPRRLQVLIDGASVYLPILSRIKWHEMPISIHDIEYVEFIRGPSTSLYRENAFLATINIVTINPRDSENFHSKTYVGDLGTKNYFMSYSDKFNQETSYKISYSYEQNTGYDIGDFSPDGRDGSRKNRFMGRLNHLKNESELDVSFGYVDSYLEEEFEIDGQTSYPDKDSSTSFISVNFLKELNRNHNIKTTFYNVSYKSNREISVLLPTVGFSDEGQELLRNDTQLAYDVFVYRTRNISDLTSDEFQRALPAILRAEELLQQGTPLTVGDFYGFFTKEHIYDLEIEDFWNVSPYKVTNVFGLKHTFSENPFNFFNKKIELTSARYMSNIEYTIDDFMVTNVGFLAEHNEFTGLEISPRLSINYLFGNRNTVRFVIARAYRVPNLYEEKHDATFLLLNPTPLIEGLNDRPINGGIYSEGGLESEKIESYNLSHIYSNNNVVIETKIFKNNLSNLISETLSDSSFGRSTNNNRSTKRGIEIEAHLPVLYGRIRLAYAYLDSVSSILVEDDLDSRHSGSVNYYKLFNSYMFSLGYYGSNPENSGHYGRTDLILNKTIRSSSDYLINLGYKLSHFDNTKINDSRDLDGGLVARSFAKYLEDATNHFFTLEVRY